MKERKKRSQENRGNGKKKKRPSSVISNECLKNTSVPWVACLWHGILLSVLALERLKIKYIFLLRNSRMGRFDYRL